MSETFVTQCPHCRTSFRVSHAQLGAAHGVVRCGACLHVFNAAQQLLAQGQGAAMPNRPAPSAMPAAKPSAPPAAPAAKTLPSKPSAMPPPGKNPSDTLWIHDDLDLDSLDLDEELAKLEEQEHQLSQQFMALEQAPKYAETFNKPPSSETDPHDERWAEALLHEHSDKAPLSLAPTETSAGKTATPPPLNKPLPPSPSSGAAPARHQPTFNPDQPLETPHEPPKAPPLRAKRPMPLEPAVPPKQEIEQQTDTELEAADQPAPSETRSKAQRSEPELRDDHLYELDEEPLLLDWQQPKKRLAPLLGWGLLNLIAAGALAGQYVHYHFAELARQDSYRPWFEQLCPVIGCSLPSKVDINQVKSSNLVVRSHPEFSGALVVDAILYNRAPFAQPFPLLEIRFSDINGRLLASRRFKPSEYLAGELAGKSEMPPQTPIHISLDILDPGNQAVNYSLSFHSPE